MQRDIQQVRWDTHKFWKWHRSVRGRIWYPKTTTYLAECCQAGSRHEVIVTLNALWRAFYFNRCTIGTCQASFGYSDMESMASAAPFRTGYTSKRSRNVPFRMVTRTSQKVGDRREKFERHNYHYRGVASCWVWGESHGGPGIGDMVRATLVLSICISHRNFDDIWIRLHCWWNHGDVCASSLVYWTWRRIYTFVQVFHLKVYWVSLFKFIRPDIQKKTHHKATKAASMPEVPSLYFLLETINGCKLSNITRCEK